MSYLLCTGDAASLHVFSVVLRRGGGRCCMSFFIVAVPVDCASFLKLSLNVACCHPWLLLPHAAWRMKLPCCITGEHLQIATHGRGSVKEGRSPLGLC